MCICLKYRKPGLIIYLTDTRLPDWVLYSGSAIPFYGSPSIHQLAAT